jgi:4-hydroxy-3-methylbut-2-enyl diphosphate reductase
MRLNLNIEIDSNAGFCFGVKRAVEMAEEILATGKDLYCLGQIVHNLEEVKRLEKLGMVTLKHEDIPNIKNTTVLIRSHGEPPETYERLRANNNSIVEATCPVVAKVQERVKRVHDSGDFVLIYGKSEHPEVIGIVGKLKNNYTVIKSIDELDIASLPGKLTLFSQTTMDSVAFEELYEFLTNSGIEVDKKDTICRKVSGKKEKLQSFAKNHHVVIMVAGKKSSNGQVLYEICKLANSRSYKISTVEEIDITWFGLNESVGITGATSTPDWQMKAVADKLHDF